MKSNRKRECCQTSKCAQTTVGNAGFMRDFLLEFTALFIKCYCIWIHFKKHSKISMDQSYKYFSTFTNSNIYWFRSFSVFQRYCKGFTLTPPEKLCISKTAIILCAMQIGLWNQYFFIIFFPLLCALGL